MKIFLFYLLSLLGPCSFLYFALNSLFKFIFLAVQFQLGFPFIGYFAFLKFIHTKNYHQKHYEKGALIIDYDCLNFFQ
jgi:hypothetical protein